MRISVLARQHIVALTQTEIMFVLAAIILILLQFKQRELEAAMPEDGQAGDPVQIVSEGKGGLADQAEQPVPDEEVKDVLVREGGDGSVLGEDGALLPARKLEKALAEADPESEVFDPEAQVKEILERAQSSGAIDAGGSLDEQVDELIRRARIGRQVEGKTAASAGGNGGRGGVSSPAPTAASGSKGSPKGSKIGFDPCWERTTTAGNLSFHATFETKYDVQRDAYMISPAWDESVPQIRDALEGPLALLKSHPAGWIAPERYAQYGNMVRNLAESLYGPECRLVTTIDEPTRRSLKHINRFFYPVLK